MRLLALLYLLGIVPVGQLEHSELQNKILVDIICTRPNFFCWGRILYITGTTLAAFLSLQIL